MKIDSFSPEDLEEFDNHKLVVFLNDPKTKLKGFIAIHRGGLLNPAFGATRIWKYTSTLEALRDVLKLSKIMSYKSALANLKYGGAKAVLIDSSNSIDERNLMIEEYAKKVDYLNGHFITGADVGVSNSDLKIMIKNSKCMIGGKSDPVKYTALGVYYAIQECIKEIFGNDFLEGRSFAIQGLGKTGEEILKLLYDKAKKIYVADLNEKTVEKIKSKFPKVEVVDVGEIHKQKVDVFSPCALSGAINSKNINNLNCKIVIGSANSQLENIEIGEKLYSEGILYASDYVVNAGGLITVADEYENGNSDEKRLEKKVGNIRNIMRTIIKESKIKNKPTCIVANEMAETMFNKFI